jgi:hypothetical protein
MGRALSRPFCFGFTAKAGGREGGLDQGGRQNDYCGSLTEFGSLAVPAPLLPLKPLFPLGILQS